MAFSSLFFLCCFLPAFLAVYALVPARHRNHVAVAGSLLFYAWGAPQVTGLLLLTAAMDFALARDIARRPERRRRALITALAVNVGCLLYFKYANFFVAQVNAGLEATGAAPVDWRQVALPIGISFYTFQKISYVCDVHAGRTPPAERFRDYLLYLLLFPQLIAGPIVRYHDIAGQISGREHSLAGVTEGAFRFCLGLGKKVLVADVLGEVADRVFTLPPGTLPAAYAWLGVVCYAFQIYFDFSGYSDMALGLSRILGFRLLENFDTPYAAASVSDFWRRWHISLSGFMREYLYIPLGGSRASRARLYANLWIVFLVSGLWHGANWTFVLWGAYHGLFLTLERVAGQDRLAAAPRLLRVAATFVVVLFSWVLFRSPTVAGAAEYAGRMLDLGGTPAPPGLPTWGDLLSGRAAFILAVAAACSFLPALSPVQRWLAAWAELEGRDRAAPGKLLLAIALLALSLCALASSGFHPFIYFRF